MNGGGGISAREDEKEQMKLLSQKKGARRGKKREYKEKLKRFPQEFSAFNFPLCSLLLCLHSSEKPERVKVCGAGK